MADQRTQQDQLIDALYELALNPNNFDSFTESWEQYLNDNQASPKPETDVSERLAQHFNRAFQILEKFGREKVADHQSLEKFIDARELPSIATDLDGRILTLNSHAKKLFTNYQEIEHAQDLVHAKSHPPLAEGLSRIANSQPFPIVVLLPNNQPSLMLLQRLPDSDTVLFDLTGSTWDTRMHATLKSMYSLTETECAVAGLLYQGLTISEIAEQESRAPDTVRQHTKSVLKKTQTHSQPRLMRLLTSFNFAQSSGEQAKWANSKCANHLLNLPDGRRYAYYDSGRKGKQVIVVLHGVLHDPELPDFMHDSLVQHGYRIIGPSRAWFGDSSPRYHNDNLLEAGAADLITLLDHLKLDSVILLGNMAGAVHAYVTAAMYPERVKRIINISGMAPLRNERQIKSMPKSVRAVVRTAKYFPKLLPTLMRTALALIDNGDIRKLFDTTYKNSALDMAATNREDVYQRLQTGYGFAAHNGSAAYTHEGLALAQDLSHYLNNIKCSTCLIHGAHDGITSLEAVEDLAQSMSKVHVTSIEDAGHLMLYTNPKTASNALIQRLAYKV